jgi:hypothetical protein
LDIRWTEEWKIWNGELCGLCLSPSVVRIIKLRRMRWARCMAHMWKARSVHKILLRKYVAANRWKNSTVMVIMIFHTAREF